MKEAKIVRFICIGAILVTLAVLFQAAPVFLPAIGLALSPLSTLPVALAAAIHFSLGIAVLFSSFLILIFLSLQEAIILLFTTGLLGIVIGTLLFRKKVIFSIFFSAIALTIGIMTLTYAVGIPAFGDFTGALSFPLTSMIFFMFSLFYVSIWNICFRKLANYLIKTKFTGNPFIFQRKF